MLKKLPQPSDLILVSFLPDPQDLEIARLLGWYRIPLRTAPKVIAVDYLAFYQPSSFNQKKWRIEIIAPVNGHELVTRAELFRDQYDHPKAHEEYFKIQLGSITQLPNPIIAEKWKRITFFYMTGEYLLKVEPFSSVVFPSEDRNLLWKALRERTNKFQTYSSQKILDFDLDPSDIASLLGIGDMTSDYKP